MTPLSFIAPAFPFAAELERSYGIDAGLAIIIFKLLLSC